MNRLSTMQVIVAGAGVFGAATALALARVGARVRLVDPAAGKGNASAIAAGMLAPAFEAALDPFCAGRFSALREARDLWPSFLEGVAPDVLVRCGAQLDGTRDHVEQAAAAFEREGAPFQRRKGLIFTPEDWRVEPRAALAAIKNAFQHLGGEIIDARLVEAGPNEAVFEDGRTITADAVVLACGYGGLDLAPELSVLSPIKGQILRYAPGVLAGGPILRGAKGYVVPSPSGAAAGATMQAGAADAAVDPDITAQLAFAAETLAPELAGHNPSAFAGVRPATPDGLPMIGWSANGTWLATGARRNGWLLAPLAAALTVTGLAGGPVEPEFAPERFSLRR